MRNQTTPDPAPIDLADEAPADAPVIHALTQRAFEGRPYAGGDEGDVVDRLRAAGALLCSLVARDAGGAIVGQVTFSAALNADGSGPWCALGPVSVEPEQQHRRIGARLIEAGLARMRAQGMLGCILTGNPSYYSRFGFVVAAQQAPEGEPAEYFQLLTFGAAKPTDRFAFHGAFYDAV